MTNEEKREFEEFLQWKKERAAQAKADEEDFSISLDQESVEDAQEETENEKKSYSSTIGWIGVIALFIFFCNS